MLDLAQYHIHGSTAREIAATAETAIRDGRLQTGAKLPTVRRLAERLGTSPATVNAAYRTLRQRGLIVADGRRGTSVAPRPALRAPVHRPLAPEHARDLAVGLPDPELLPVLGPALGRLEVENALDGLESGNPRLLELAVRDFEVDGVRAERIAVVGGAFDGIERALGAHLRPGDRVIIEDPVYPSIRDLLLALGLETVPVAVDECGLIPDALGTALRRGADAIVIVPRSHNPTGGALTEERAATLRELLSGHDLLVIEDDHAGKVAGVEFVSLGDGTERWAVIRSVSKFIHPDLRLALMAGDETTIGRLEGRQAVGTRWVSHLLQAVVADVLSSAEFPATVARARDAYADRRGWLLRALAGHGIEAYGRSGLNVWVPVREEAPVVRRLLEEGFLVMSGERFRINSPAGIRVTTASLRPGEADRIAGVIAEVEHAGRPRRTY